ncbi:hypothetical protein AB0392_58005, partial [Nonomuraea angiospora]|uniref:hypothetical protein n=1 Tax=Nonomuraea angiospora TaxID=46172 RepID=UPI00344F7AF0
ASMGGRKAGSSYSRSTRGGRLLEVVQRSVSLMSGALAMERHARDSDRPAGRLTGLLLDALRPRP